MELTKPITVAELKSFDKISCIYAFESPLERTATWYGITCEINGDSAHITRFFNSYLTTMHSPTMAGAIMDGDVLDEEDVPLNVAVTEINRCIKAVNNAKKHVEEGYERMKVVAHKSSMHGFKTATYGRKGHRDNITQLENSIRRMF